MAKRGRTRKSYERKADEPVAITPAEYSGLQEAYDHFNRELFDGALGDVFITYQRRANSLGYFGADRFAGRMIDGCRHELALNPDGFVGKSDKEICSTLVHEQVHVWQHAKGTAPTRGYHDKEWAAAMKAIGLQPSSTGMPGGRETGQKMDHYIIRGGAFEQAYERLAATNWRLNLESAHRPGDQRKAPSSKTKFTCPVCGQNVWGKPNTQALCLFCFSELAERESVTLNVDAVTMISAGASKAPRCRSIVRSNANA
jgi:predicted SprT family Zn-dependent metalloprotease